MAASDRARRKAAVAARKHPWRRRVVTSVVAVLFTIPVIGGAGWWYVNYQLGKIHTVAIAPGALHVARPGEPFNILLIGSDTRQFETSSSQSGKFGSSGVVTGQRSDVVIVAHVVPKTKQVYMLSIPRDLYVDIPGSVPYISGMNRINASFNSGPTLLIETLKKDLGIPIDHFAEINFAGFQGMVDAVGGIHINFPNKLQDPYSNLSIDHTGCQLIKGGEALAYVRSRHVVYDQNGVYVPDYGSDWSRIRRQDVFFQALLHQVRNEVINPVAMTDLLGAVVKNLAIDSTMSKTGLLSLAYDFRGASSTSIHTEVLPTTPKVLPSGADVLLPAQPYDRQMVASLLAIGEPHTSTTTPTTTPTTVAGSPSTSTSTSTTTAPASSSSVVFDRQPEPWNGTPC